jgi:uncharacterized protein
VSLEDALPADVVGQMEALKRLLEKSEDKTAWPNSLGREVSDGEVVWQAMPVVIQEGRGLSKPTVRIPKDFVWGPIKPEIMERLSGGTFSKELHQAEDGGEHDIADPGSAAPGFHFRDWQDWQDTACPSETKHVECAAELKAADEDEEEGVFEGLASTFGNVDLVGDIIKRGAFKGSLAERPPGKVKMLLGHNAGGIPIGVWESIKETRQGLAVKGRLLLKIGQAADVFEAMKAGVMDSLSIGFRTLEEDFDKEGRRLIKAVDLLEISVVNFPANPKAQITSVKQIDVSPEDITCKRDLENVLRDAGFSKALTGYLVAGWEPPARRDAEGEELVAEIKRLIETITPAT